MTYHSYISIEGARENNLKNLRLKVPHGKLIAVTGVSGSGKTSLAFDTIAAEANRKYLETIPSFARQFAGKIRQPEVDSVSGLYPVILLSQKPPGKNAKSTVGTVSEIYDYLRLLYARFGEASTDLKLSRSLFSFNSPLGACPHCAGLGLEERISLDKLIDDPSKTLREGALVPTLPNGYIMYSQVTIEVLDTVCREHGFSVDIPWKELTEEQQKVVLYGSERIKVLKGKHSIESRLRWTALKAKPREMGYYTGMIPVMEDILRRDRNRNILRFAESVQCTQCKGKRLNEQALSVRYRSAGIDELSEMELWELKDWFGQIQVREEVEARIQQKVLQQLDLLCNLGEGHLSLSRNTDSLSGGELQRIRLVNQLSAEMSQVLYVFDEPSTGMHARDVNQLIRILRRLVEKGNTVMVVEHDPDIIRQADWILETGPEAGIRGGELLFNGPMEDFLAQAVESTPTRRILEVETPFHSSAVSGQLQSFTLPQTGKLEGGQYRFVCGGINCITGVPGSGKSTLVYRGLLPQLKKAIRVDHSPIGRTPRSNPATYTGLADHIRDLFAAQPNSKERGYKKGRFSFNTKGGRCEKCEGAGKLQIGMHYMGSVDIPCDACNGSRFNAETLEVRYQGKNISEVYDLSIRQALEFFREEKTIRRYLEALQSLGLGYLKLGQSSTTLSGGEAQRIKLAAALVGKLPDHSWIILDEPTTGLHYADTQVLLQALRALTARGITLVVIEYQEQFIRSSDWLLDLGPESGRRGGRLLYEGPPAGLSDCSESLTARYIKEKAAVSIGKTEPRTHISLTGCRTHNLKNIDVHIPLHQTTVITGVSGSGKSSLAFDTLYAESRSRFTESMSTFSRSFIKQANEAKADGYKNLCPAIAVNRKNLPVSPRSTVGTLTGIHEKFRYLYSRVAQEKGQTYTARNFSFNHEAGACPLCAGLGYLLKADPEKMAPDKSLSLAAGALTHNKSLKYYGDQHSQYMALFLEAGKTLGVEANKPVKDYTPEQLELLWWGSGDIHWHTSWHYKTRTSSGIEKISGLWKGFARLIEDEYHSRLHNKNLDSIKSLLSETTCPQCHGARLNSQALAVMLCGYNIAGLSALSFKETREWFEGAQSKDSAAGKIIQRVYAQISPLLDTLGKLGLAHLSPDRSSGSLSGGEGQRLRLAQQLSGGLSGLTLVLDEPSIGLHNKDIDKLLEVLTELKEKGNTLVIVAHERKIMRKADYLIELGPASGRGGGKIVAEGDYASFLKSGKAISSPYLKRDLLPAKKDRPVQQDAFGLKGVHLYNLQDRDFSFDAGGIIALTGVSGAGKSTLVHQVLSPSLRTGRPVHCREVYEKSDFDQYVEVGHRAIGGHVQSTVASYTGLLDKLAAYYATSAEVRAAKLGKSAFTYTSKQGRCPQCKGSGKNRISMDFMEDVWNTCESCGGMRYADEVLGVQVEGKSMGDLLLMSLDETAEFFKSRPGGKAKSVYAHLRDFQEMGLGHLVVGQETASLSGGEAQRLKLCLKMKEAVGKKVLFLLDEPSSGLHYADLDQLIQVFNRLADQGHTVLFIEHNPYLIAIANQVVKL